MKKKILYVFINNWADFEYSHLASSIHFFKDKYQNAIVGIDKNPVISSGGLKVIPDYSIENAKNINFEVLVLIGSSEWKNIHSKELDDFVKETAQKGNLIAGICNAASYLGTIGLLNNVKHTANDLEDLKKWAGQAYTNEQGFQKMQCVHDKNIITANGTAFLEFARDVMLSLDDIPKEGTLQWYNFNKNGLYQK